MWCVTSPQVLTPQPGKHVAFLSTFIRERVIHAHPCVFHPHLACRPPGDARAAREHFSRMFQQACGLLLPQTCQLALFNFSASGELTSRLSRAMAAGLHKLILRSIIKDRWRAYLHPLKYKIWLLKPQFHTVFTWASLAHSRGQDIEWDEERYCDEVHLGQILKSPPSSPPELWLFITRLNCETALSYSCDINTWGSARQMGTREEGRVLGSPLCRSSCKCLHLLITRSLLKINPWPTGLKSVVSIYL